MVKKFWTFEKGQILSFFLICGHYSKLLFGQVDPAISGNLANITTWQKIDILTSGSLTKILSLGFLSWLGLNILSCEIPIGHRFITMSWKICNYFCKCVAFSKRSRLTSKFWFVHFLNKCIQSISWSLYCSVYLDFGKLKCLNLSQNEISRHERADDKILDLQAISQKFVVQFW